MSLRARVNALLFRFVAWFHLYVLGACYVFKELHRKVSPRVRHLSLSDADIPARPGHVVVVTGGTRGIGLETVKALVLKKCHVIVGSSSFTHSPSVRALISSGHVEVWPLDLSSFASVARFAHRFKAQHQQLHVLVNNAAVMFAPYSRTCDGFESHFQVNYLSHALLTFLLLPTMAPGARIVNVSSSTHFARNLNLSDLQSHAQYSPHHAYAQSKLAQVMFTYSLSAWLKERARSVTVNCLHPGVANTQLYEHVFWVRLVPQLASLLFRSPRAGAETIIYCSLSTELDSVSGQYFEDCRAMASSSYSRDQQCQSQLFAYTMHALNNHTQFT